MHAVAPLLTASPDSLSLSGSPRAMGTPWEEEPPTGVLGPKAACLPRQRTPVPHRAVSPGRCQGWEDGEGGWGSAQVQPVPPPP